MYLPKIFSDKWYKLYCINFGYTSNSLYLENRRVFVSQLAILYVQYSNRLKTAYVK